MKSQIEKKLKKCFTPTFLEVIDESHLHAGHAAARPEGQSHFYIKIAGPFFENLNRIQRHQAVYNCLATELNEGVHALRMQVLSPEELEAASSESR